jgi:hypothetical protein
VLAETNVRNVMRDLNVKQNMADDVEFGQSRSSRNKEPDTGFGNLTVTRFFGRLTTLTRSVSDGKNCWRNIRRARDFPLGNGLRHGGALSARISIFMFWPSRTPPLSSLVSHLFHLSRDPLRGAVPPSRLYRRESDPAQPGGSAFLMDQGGQAGDALDSAIVSSIPGQ